MMPLICACACHHVLGAEAVVCKGVGARRRIPEPRTRYQKGRRQSMASAAARWRI